jgi:hypothetical protein
MNKNFLQNPSYLELDDAYRGLAKHQEIHIKATSLQEVLKDMEKVGFVAMEITNVSETRDTWTIKASKGKHGPCRFTGSTVAYIGCAVAALDDDLHLLPQNQPISVCDKTYAVHALPAYHGLMDCKEGNGGSGPTEDDQDDFDTLLGKMYDQLKGAEQSSSDRKMLFYHGPFRLLILRDGTIVRRGKWNAVPTDLASELIEKEGLTPSVDVGEEKPVFFQDRYREEGAKALMDELLQLREVEQTDRVTDFSSLDVISHPLRSRLLKLLDENKKYFVLVGSDISDRLGCCPSEEVTEANRLVKNGILNAYSEPLQGDSCPLTFYSVKGELSVTSDGFEVEFNPKFRGQIRKRLVKASSGPRRIIMWLLIIFVAISTIIGGVKLYQLSSVPLKATSYDQLEPLVDGQLQFVLFHNEKRCHQCLQMEQMTRDVISDAFSDVAGGNKLVFKTVTIDDPANHELVSQLGIFAATLVFVEFDGETLAYARVLNEATELYRDESAFKDYLTRELSGMLHSDHE